MKRLVKCLVPIALAISLLLPAAIPASALLSADHDPVYALQTTKNISVVDFSLDPDHPGDLRATVVKNLRGDFPLGSYRVPSVWIEDEPDAKAGSRLLGWLKPSSDKNYDYEIDYTCAVLRDGKYYDATGACFGTEAEVIALLNGPVKLRSSDLEEVPTDSIGCEFPVDEPLPEVDLSSGYHTDQPFGIDEVPSYKYAKEKLYAFSLAKTAYVYDSKAKKQLFAVGLDDSLIMAGSSVKKDGVRYVRVLLSSTSEGLIRQDALKKDKKGNVVESALSLDSKLLGTVGHSAYIYEKPDKTTAKVGVVRKGTCVAIIALNDKYYRVLLSDGSSGYADQSCVTVCKK